ncbi:Hypothetical predicted protein [Octopus vulgaris]|uniref:Uncharacterized protein n=1 Tax=Octopus vulgaris TaxID=6645 RepID=A0AA36AUP8_OCTVU|nr:Hypothetical predicted protein [Octopus vulgaris]
MVHEYRNIVQSLKQSQSYLQLKFMTDSMSVRERLPQKPEIRPGGNPNTANSRYAVIHIHFDRVIVFLTNRKEIIIFVGRYQLYWTNTIDPVALDKI